MRNWSNEYSPIFIVSYDEIDGCLQASQALKQQGLLVLAIRPPTVASPRLRICISAKHKQEELSLLAKSLAKIQVLN